MTAEPLPTEIDMSDTRLVDQFGRAAGREPAILANVGLCLPFAIVLIGLCCYNFTLFGDRIVTYPDPLLKFQPTYMLMTEMDLRIKCTYIACLLLALLFWGRLGLLVRAFGRHNGVLLVMLPLMVLGYFPLADLLNYSANSFVNGLGGYTAHGAFRWSALQDTLLPAGSLCGLATIFVLMRTLAFPRKRLRLYEDGVLITAKSLSMFTGDCPVTWQQIEKVDLVRPPAQPGKPQGDPKVVLTFDQGKQAEFTWDELKSGCEPSELFNALKTYAPKAISADMFPEASKKIEQTETYTELWLKYFTSSVKRERTGQLEPGSVLAAGKYKVLGSIGAGGQGTAYLAAPRVLDESLSADNLVLKEYILPLHRGEALFQQSMAKLQHEAEILQRINHAQIVKLVDTFVEDHRGYLVLEFVEGKSLKQIVQTDGALPESRVVELAIQICNVLEYLHGLSPAVIHRDLTPDNLMLQDSGEIKLVDFNVAHQLESAATATVVGKHAYIPPEQFRGKPTAQSDIYALGGTLHYLLTAAEPEPLTVSKPRKLRPELSEQLDLIVARSTHLDPAKRYLSASEMRADLQMLALGYSSVEMSGGEILKVKAKVEEPS